MPKATLVYNSTETVLLDNNMYDLSVLVRESLADMIGKDITWIDFVCQPVGYGSVLNSAITLEIEFISSGERLKQFNQVALKELKEKILDLFRTKNLAFSEKDFGIWTKPLHGSVHI